MERGTRIYKRIYFFLYVDKPEKFIEPVKCQTRSATSVLIKLEKNYRDESQHGPRFGITNIRIISENRTDTDAL